MALLVMQRALQPQTTRILLNLFAQPPRRLGKIPSRTHFGMISLTYSICFSRSVFSAAWLLPSHVRRDDSAPKMTV